MGLLCIYKLKTKRKELPKRMIILDYIKPLNEGQTLKAICLRDDGKLYLPIAYNTIVQNYEVESIISKLSINNGGKKDE